MPRSSRVIDRAAIDAAWNKVGHMVDPVHDDEVADTLLRNASLERPGIEHALAHIELINATDRGSIDALGYGFVRDRTLWRRASEATFQARALQQLSHWWTLNPADAPALCDVVVRHTFATGFAFGTPQHMVADRIHFIVIPFVYAELLMLSAKTLNTMLVGSEAADAWQPLAMGRHADEATVPGAMRQLLARLLTDHAFHAAEAGDNPTALLMAQSPWFDYEEGDRPPGALETHLSYAALDFAIAHELGHRILHVAAPETRPGSILEQAADLIGFRLFAASWGWRDDIFEGCPLGDAARILIGPLWFFCSARLLLVLQQALAERVRMVAPGSSLARSLERPALHLSLLVKRWAHHKTTLGRYAEVMAAFDVAPAPGDGDILSALETACEQLIASLPRWVTTIPDADIRFAATLRSI